MSELEGSTRIGHALGPHGVQGAVKVFVIGNPQALLKLPEVHVEGLGWRAVRRAQAMSPAVLLWLTGFEDRDAAARLRGLALHARDRDLPPLPEGEYYYHQLRGLPVLDPQGMALGTVHDVQDSGHQDLLVLRHAGDEALELESLELESLVPLQAPYVEVVTENGAPVRIVLDAPPGLLGGGEDAAPGGEDAPGDD